jgi:hypothetical protein
MKPTAQMTCPVCSKPLPPPKATGRPRTYDKDQCRRAVERAKERLLWAQEEAAKWRDRWEQFGHDTYRVYAGETEAEVRELERIVGAERPWTLEM